MQLFCKFSHTKIIHFWKRISKVKFVKMDEQQRSEQQRYAPVCDER